MVEVEDYITWSVIKVNKHTSDIFSFFFFHISFHCFMICVLQFQKNPNKTETKPTQKNPPNKNNKKPITASSITFIVYHSNSSCWLQLMLLGSRQWSANISAGLV